MHALSLVNPNNFTEFIVCLNTKCKRLVEYITPNGVMKVEDNKPRL